MAPRIPAIPTKYNGRQYRSMLEARWAAMFDLLGWRFEYEAFELSAYIPDFLLLGANGRKVIVEVKPLTVFDQEPCDKARRAMVGTHAEGLPILLLGCSIQESSEVPGSAQLGWLDGVEAVFGGNEDAPKEIDFVSSTSNGLVLSGRKYTSFIASDSWLNGRWAQAGSTVQWHPSAASKPRLPTPVDVPKAPRAATAPYLDSAEEWFTALLIADPSLRSDPLVRFVDEIGVIGVRLLLLAPNPEEHMDALPDPMRGQLEIRLGEIARNMGGPEHVETRKKALIETCRKMRLSRIDEMLRDTWDAMRSAEKSRAPEVEVERVQAHYMELSAARTSILSEKRA